MKKKIFLLFFVLMLLSGCVKSTTTMKVNTNKSINFTTDFYISKDIENSSVLDIIAKDKLVANGYNISTINGDNNYSGVRVTKRFNNIDKISNALGNKVTISDLLKGTMDDKVMFKVKKSFFKNTYFADYDYRLRSEINANTKEDEESEVSDQMISLEGEMVFKFVLEVPYKTIQNNASEVSEDGNTLTWTFNKSEDSNIRFTFTLLNLMHIYLVIAGGVIALILFIIVVVILIKNRREALKNSGPIHVDYDPAIEDKLDDFEAEEETAPEVAEVSANNVIGDNSFEFKTQEEEKAKIAIVEAAKAVPPEKKAPKFINTNSVEEIVDFNNSNNNVK